jgi:N-acyl-D-aspartate/D-glutamate deacylase
MTEPSRGDWEASAEAWRDGNVVIGASDAGAHLDFTAYFDYPVYIIEKAVRDHGVLSLEEAVHLMTDVPARLYGLRDRGRLVVGSHAHIVVFDEGSIASGAIVTRFDLPAGAGLLYAEPVGIDHVIVNGTAIASGGALTGARPGRLLRSGRDTDTPPLD